jgi:competence ComEA-like helix-hairpin-helix protein
MIQASRHRKDMDDPLTKINTATPEEVQTLHDVGAKVAQRIVEHREEHGYLRGPEDLAQVHGISPEFAKYLNQFIDWRVPHKSKIINLCLDFCHYLQQSRIWRHGKWLRGYGWRVAVVVATLLTIITAGPIVWKSWTTGDSSRAASSADPIRIDYKENMGLGPVGVIQHFDPDKLNKRSDDPYKNLEYYIKRHSIAYSFPSINVDIVSRVDREWIKLAPYLVVQIRDTKPVPETVDFLSPLGAGGGGNTDAFTATLSPNRDQTFGAPQVRATMSADERKAYSPNQKPFDYFTLRSGEREVFELNINTMPGYYYYYRIGILYSYKGRQSVKWIDKTFVAALPAKADKAWAIEGTYGARELSLDDSVGFYNSSSMKADMSEHIRKEEEIVQKYESGSSFRLPQGS